MDEEKGWCNLDLKKLKSADTPLGNLAYPALETLLGFNRRVVRKIEREERKKAEAISAKPMTVQLLLFERPQA